MQPTVRIAFLIGTLTLAKVAAPPASAQGGNMNMRCENATNPTGITAFHPQLSWAINPGVIQRAYQVLVATSAEKLKANQPDLWDSGRVISDQKSVPYKGHPLASFQHCYWTVRIWETYYQASLYPEPATFEMGYLSFDTKAR